MLGNLEASIHWIIACAALTQLLIICSSPFSFFCAWVFHFFLPHPTSGRILSPRGAAPGVRGVPQRGQRHGAAPQGRPADALGERRLEGKKASAISEFLLGACRGLSLVGRILNLYH